MLFPEPVMVRLRAVARQQNRPVSELVRRAVDRLPEKMPALPPKQPARFPTFQGGGVLVDADRLNDAVHGPAWKPVDIPGCGPHRSSGCHAGFDS
jgi:hypothetical protein